MPQQKDLVEACLNAAMVYFMKSFFFILLNRGSFCGPSGTLCSGLQMTVPIKFQSQGRFIVAWALAPPTL